MISAESLQRLFQNAPAESPVSDAPGPRFALVTCMDRRLRPEECVGLPSGSARVIRNAGGRVSDDALRSLIIAWSELGAEEVVVIHHTDCTVGKHTNDELRQAVTAASGANASQLDFLAFTDLERSVWDDVERIRTCKLIPADFTVVGFVYDLDRARLDLVAGDPRSQLPFARQAPGPPRRAVAPTVPPADLTAPPSDPGDLAALSQLPPPPVLPPPTVFQPAAPSPRPPAGRVRRPRSAAALIGFLVVGGFVLAAILNQHTTTQTTTVTVPSLDLTLPTALTLPTSVPPTTPPVPPAAPPATGAVAYQDPLSGPSPGFTAAPNDKNANTNFINGSLQIFATNFYADTETVSGLSIANVATVDVEVSAAKVGGSNGYFGIGCRLSSDATSGYFLMINGERDAEITRRKPGTDEQVLASSTGADVVNPAPALNDVRAVCTGAAGQPAHLMLIVNGRTLLDATDTARPYGPGGTVGIALNTAGSNADGTATTARFNNLVVRTTDPTAGG